MLPSAGAGTFQGFSIYFLDPASYEVTGRIYARTATYESGRWILREGWSRDFHESGETFERFALPSARSEVRHMARDARGRIWMALSGANKVAVVE